MTLSGTPGQILMIFKPARSNRLRHCNSERSIEERSASIAMSDAAGHGVTPLFGRTISLIMIREYPGFMAAVVFFKIFKQWLSGQSW